MSVKSSYNWAGTNATLAAIANQLTNTNRLCDVDVNEAVSTIVQSHLSIETYTDGVAQAETTVAVGTIVADPGGDATVTVTAAGMENSPKAVTVALLLNDDATVIGGKIRDALNADDDVSAFFTVSGTEANIVLTAKTPAENDTTMNIAIATGTATGLTADATSTNTTTGSKNEIVHPSILFFPNKWNGYKYWIAYTPFDNGNSDVENPSIAVSNDNVTWVTPVGLINPLEAYPGSGNYYADVNLFMSADNKTMNMVFKYAGVTKITYLRSTTDGVNWTPKVKLFENSFEDVSYSVFWDGTQYVMLTVKPDDTPNGLYMRTSSTPEGVWAAPTLCTITLPNPATQNIWHIDVRKVGNQYHMLAMIQDSGDGSNPQYFGKSNDLLTWEFSKQPIFHRGASGSINYTFYKATMFPMISDKGLKYGLWYGTAIPYYVCYSEITFDRSELIKEGNNNILQASIPLYPWLVGDTFNRTDGVVGTSTSGAVWSNVLGNDFNVISNKCGLVAATNSRVVVDLAIDDFYVEVKMDACTGSGYLLFRYTDDSNYWRVGVSGGKYTLQRMLAGTLTTIITNIHSFIAGERLGVECNGNIIKIYVNGKVVYTLTDTANNTATKVGLNTGETATRFDNFVARALY